jgi:hypothetical protein
MTRILKSFSASVLASSKSAAVAKRGQILDRHALELRFVRG